MTGYDERGRILRRSMVRYLNLSLVLVLRSISSAVKQRFPTFEHIVEAGQNIFIYISFGIQFLCWYEIILHIMVSCRAVVTVKSFLKYQIDVLF